MTSPSRNSSNMMKTAPRKSHGDKNDKESFVDDSDESSSSVDSDGAVATVKQLETNNNGSSSHHRRHGTSYIPSRSRPMEADAEVNSLAPPQRRKPKKLLESQHSYGQSSTTSTTATSDSSYHAVVNSQASSSSRSGSLRGADEGLPPLTGQLNALSNPSKMVQSARAGGDTRKKGVKKEYYAEDDIEHGVVQEEDDNVEHEMSTYAARAAVSSMEQDSNAKKKKKKAKMPKDEDSRNVRDQDSNVKKKAKRPKNENRIQPGAVRVRGTDEEDPSSHFDDHEEEEDFYPVDETGFIAQSGAEENNEEEYSQAQYSDTSSYAADGIVAYAVDEPSVVHEAKIVNKTRQRRLRYLMIAIILIILAVAIIVPVIITTQDNGGGGTTTTTGSTEITFQAMIADLCSPRHLKVHEQKLFIAEAGEGPVEIAGDRETETLCLPSTLSAIPGGICFGTTGQVSVFDLNSENMQPPALSNLFSARPTEGGFTNQVYGAHAVDFDANGNMFTLLGLGYVDALQVAITGPSLVFASVLKNSEKVASPWVKLFQNNYANAEVVESNPFHLSMHDGTTYVVDAGADLLYTYLNIETAGNEEPDSVIVLPTIDNIPAVEANPRGGPCNDVEPPMGPSFCGKYQDDAGNWLYSANAVPTVVHVNPALDKLFVGYLGGAIWNEPVSGIFVMDLDADGIPLEETIQVMRGGNFWAIVDFDFYKDQIFILETNPGGFVPFEGRVSRATLGEDGSIRNVKVVTEDLFQPVSMVIHEDTIYLSNNTFNMGIDDCNGQILRANLK